MCKNTAAAAALIAHLLNLIIDEDMHYSIIQNYTCTMASIPGKP